MREKLQQAGQTRAAASAVTLKQPLVPISQAPTKTKQVSIANVFGLQSRNELSDQLLQERHPDASRAAHRNYGLRGMEVRGD